MGKECVPIFCLLAGHYHWVMCFTYVFILQPSGNPMRWVLLPFPRWGSWDPGMLCDLPQVLMARKSQSQDFSSVLSDCLAPVIMHFAYKEVQTQSHRCSGGRGEKGGDTWWGSGRWTHSSSLPPPALSIDFMQVLWHRWARSVPGYRKRGNLEKEKSQRAKNSHFTLYQIFYQINE